MIKIIRPNTAVRIKKDANEALNPIPKNEDGFPIEDWQDLIDQDILVEWHNRHGMDIYQASANQAQDPAYIRLWYIPGITPDCRIVRLEDGAIFEIIGAPDDIINQHQQLEIELRRYIGG